MAREPKGHLLGIPYNWDRPTRTDAREGIWDPGDYRIFPPKTYGWGYGLNLSALVQRLTRH